MAKLLHCLLPEGHPCLFRICPNFKVCCLNLEADQISFVLQAGDTLPVKIKHIVHPNGECFPEILFAHVKPSCLNHDGSVEPSIFMGVIRMPTLRRIILEVGDYEFSFI